MTFSIVGRCRRSGMLGVAITTSSICVGARCPHVRAGVGAVASQNITDPALGTAILDQLATGLTAPQALRAVLNDHPHPAYRQIAVIDHHGNSACHAGSRMLGIHGESADTDCHAAGNLLANETIPAAITSHFARHEHERDHDHLAERLLGALEAGLAAGGEQGEVHSAALLVAHEHSFPLVDLRIDWHDHDPVAALRDLWHDYRPQMNDYLTRAVNPATAPAYGVPGDR